jgi:hypothetical protein
MSDDGIHFREPLPDFVFLQAGADGAWDQRGLIHGQGYVNVGDTTYIYYGSWDPSHNNDGVGAVGLARMRRDGFGYLSVRETEDALLTTAPIPPQGPNASLYLNADGLSQDARLVIELIDKLGAPLAGYAGADAAVIRHSGLHLKAAWPRRVTIDRAHAPFRVRMRFTGAAVQQIRLYAVYIE